MSQGTSGDQMWMDYGHPKNDLEIDRYVDEVALSAYQAYKAITYHDHVPLAMAETTLTLRRRVPDADRLAWARSIVATMGDRVPRTIPEVYTREAIHLHEEPQRALKLQAIRVGELGIAAIPNEVFALTGLKIKSRSPLLTTMNIELANGSEGYIPPPEQHVLGGYTTWPARTAALEVQAEPKIVATVIGLVREGCGPVPTHSRPGPACLCRAHPGFTPARLLAARGDGERDGPRCHRPREPWPVRERRRLLPAGCGSAGLDDRQANQPRPLSGRGPAGGQYRDSRGSV
ncbi:MAG: hypothetical protein ABSE84_17110 [Isosphaeraceae bacterium]